MKQHFTNLFFLLLSLIFIKDLPAQDWQFLKGGQTTNQAPTYNTLGSANPTTTPGSRMGMAGYTIPNTSKLYLFGGNNSSNYYNSVFVYDVLSNNWTYTAGANTANATGIQPAGMGNEYPSARSGVGFSSAPFTSNNTTRMIISSGFGYATNSSTTSGLLNNLWYTNNNVVPTFSNYTGSDVASAMNEIPILTGVNTNSGGVNYPSFFINTSFTNTWLFGGVDAQGFTNNAMLRRSINPTGFASRVAGTFDREDPGTYSGQGNTGIPAARAYAAYWRDASGNFWIFGGSSPDNGVMNDLWRFNPTTNAFTLIKGTSKNTTASYGTVNVSATSNFPPARTQAAAVVGTDGNFYLFGGANGTNYYNDLWQFNPITNRWTWLKGSNTPNASASGFLTVNDPSATPGAAKGAMAWLLNTTMYIYGGEGYDGSGNFGRLGDLWRIPLNNFTITTLPVKLTSFTVTLHDNKTKLQWQTASETNTKHYEVEYSNDGLQFELVGVINASGNSSTSRNYNTTHNINQNTLHFYRLKIVDIDGSFTYSNIEKLRTTVNATVNISPTFFHETINISVTASKTELGTLVVQNSLGQTIIRKQLQLIGGSQNIPVQMPNTSKGIYYASIEIGDTKNIFKIIKQ